MFTAFKTLPELLEYFAEEETCIKYLEQQRWGDNVSCVHCGCTKVYRTNRGYKCADRYCAKRFSVRYDTIYQNSNLSLRIWFAAVYLAISSKKGVNSHHLSRELGITQKTAWFVLHRIREMLREKMPVVLSGVIEVDESFVGGKNGNRHRDKRFKYARNAKRRVADKTPVMGLLQRDGPLITVVIPDTTSLTLQQVIVDKVEYGSIIVSDDFMSYRGLNYAYDHKAVKKSGEKKYYVVDKVYHTQNIEGFWSHLKRAIMGVYHNVSKRHLQRYCDHQTFLYNTRHFSNPARFEYAVKNSDGRLRYKDLILKT